MTKKTAQDTMSARLVTINVNENMETAYRRMQRRHFRHLPVADDNGEIVGMLSDRDVQRAMISELRRELPTPVASETIRFDPEARVRDYMGWPVQSVDRGSDLRVVADRMLKERVSAFLVTDARIPIGIVTTDDLLKVLMDLLADPKTPAHWTLHSLIEETTHRFDGVLV
jgi:CBS domain-containing protein